MNKIRPITKPVNYGEVLDWELNIASSRQEYEDFIALRIGMGNSEEEARTIWENNFGKVPMEEPKRFYQCHIISTDLRMAVTVVQTKDYSSPRKYQVIKLNEIYLDNYDYIRTMTKDEGDRIIFTTEYIDLSEDITTDNINYEDSDWFSALHFKNILGRLKIKLTPYEDELEVAKDEKSEPTIYINSMTDFESSQFDFSDEEFREKLYDKINEAFMKVENLLK